MKASDYIIQFLVEHGVDTIFGYIGGMITHLVDSASKNPQVQFIQTYHEQSAAFAAEGYARIKNLPGVAMTTSGPGALNILTSVGNAYFDSVPMIYITGQVNTYEYKYDHPVRQQGFQETDVVSMARPVTKYAVMIDLVENIRYELEKAWYLASSGRKGPVLLDLPMDIQRAEIQPENMRSFQLDDSSSELPNLSELTKYLHSFFQAERPLILIGGGCANANLKPELKELLAAGIPMVCSLQGKGILPEDSPNFMGMLGSYGNRAANLAVARADALLVLGSRLDTRQTGNQKDTFSANKIIYHFDIDANELKYNRIPNRICWCGDLAYLKNIFPKPLKQLKARQAWLAEISNLKRNYSIRQEMKRFIKNKVPYEYMRKLDRMADQNSIYCVDIGQNQMWAAQTLQLRGTQKFLTSGGMAPMGYAIPAAIGAAFATKGQQPVIAISGDGGLQIAMQSLLLITQYHLPISVMLFNNRALGMITQFQTLYFDRNYAATTQNGGYLNPDFEALSTAFGLPYKEIQKPEQLCGKLHHGLWNLLIHRMTTVSPKLEYNQPNYNMTPFLPKQELQAIMSGKGTGK